jgi:endonuclease/exonuclease/phosphatase family metal-dependent hydrolase
MRVVSWNIHWGCGKDGRIRIHAIIDVLRKLNPDVICLQEVAANHPELEGSASANQFKQLSGAFGGYHAIEHAPSEIYRNNMPRLFGNLVLSKYRITQAFRHLLPWPPDPAASGMPRGAIEVVLDAPRGKVRLVTSHLEYYSALQRHAQIDQLKYLHWEACERARLFQPDPTLDAPFQLGFRPATAIYCGDFNFTPASSDYQQLLAPREPGAMPLLDAWSIRHGRDMPRPPTAGIHGFRWPEKADCFDYFFLTEDLADAVVDVEVQSETAASDHQPIVLDLA